jgi:hypothetical protein
MYQKSTLQIHIDDYSEARAFMIKTKGGNKMEKDMKSIETEEIKPGSALSLEELDSLIQDQDLSPGTRDMLWKQRESVVEEMKQKALKRKDPISGIKAILEIPEHEGLGEKIVNLGKISVRVLFWRATESLDAEQVKLVGQVLRRVDPNGNGLRDEPYWTMFLDNGKKSFSDDAQKIIKAMNEVGINKEGQDEYVNEVMRFILLRVLHGTDEEILTDAILNHENLLYYIAKFYGFENLDWEDQQRLLSAGDILLGKWFREYGPQYLEKACQVYKYLNEKVTGIDKRYMEIVKIREGYLAKKPTRITFGYAISVKLVEMRIRRIIRGIAKEFNIKII